MKLACLFFSIIISMTVSAQSQWEQLSRDDQAEFLTDLEYKQTDTLPGLKVLCLGDEDKFSLQDIPRNFRDFVEKVFETSDEEISRESIEQSDYEAYGDEEILSLCLLLGENEEVLGGAIGFYQDGRDEDGQEGDINWQANLIFDQNAEVFRNSDGQAYSDLYFDWSGH